MRPTRLMGMIASLALALCFVPSIGRADTDGCIAVGTQDAAVAGQRPWDCFYTATGPSYYVADTTNPFVIAVSRDGGGSWTELVRRSHAGAPTAGFLKTQPNDLVSVSITCWDYTRSRSCGNGPGGGRFGVLAARSQF
ncbi:MAG: hypothetical protein ABR552_10365 [Actinomycetota bacterium]|nr:hypothetical protein [Actinomycetota bacterium]